MAIHHSTNLNGFLGRKVFAVEVINGRSVEHEGTCIGVINAVPGAPLDPALILQHRDGTVTDWLHLSDVSVRLQ